MRTLTIIKIVEEDYTPTAEDLQSILDKYGDPVNVEKVKNEVLAHNIMEEDLKLAHERFKLTPKQLILFKVKTSQYERDPATINKLITDFSLVVGEAIDSKDQHPFLVMNDTVDVEIINFSDYVVVE